MIWCSLWCSLHRADPCRWCGSTLKPPVVRRLCLSSFSAVAFYISTLHKRFHFWSVSDMWPHTCRPLSSRKFLNSTWGWTCTLSGSFILLLSISAQRSASVSLQHLSRLGALGFLCWACRCLLTLLEDAAGACYEPISSVQESEGTVSPSPLLLLHEDQTKASCLRAGMMWRGYEVSQEVLILCLCCLLLVEELSVFRLHLDQATSLHRSPGAPLRFIFLLCIILLALWMFLLLCLLSHFPKFPSQQLGGAVGYLGWRGLYQGWFRLKPSWGCPGPPGEGLLTAADKQPW